MSTLYNQSICPASNLHAAAHFRVLFASSRLQISSSVSYLYQKLCGSFFKKISSMVLRTSNQLPCNKISIIVSTWFPQKIERKSSFCAETKLQESQAFVLGVDNPRMLE